MPCYAIQRGSHAPALAFTQLLQAPAGSRTDWRSLRGKVVVLEFWATWCGPCIAAMPHLNSLAESLDPSAVQFISVDDGEPAGTVQEFLSKRKMAGWSGIDPTAVTAKRYGVTFIPNTFVIDAQGRVAARLAPDELKREDLLALASGKKPKFEHDASRDAAIRTISTTSGGKGGQADSSSKPLFEMALRESEPGSQSLALSFGMSKEGMDVRNADPSALLRVAFHVPAERMTLHTTLPHGSYDFHLFAPGEDPEHFFSDLQTAVTSVFGLRVRREKELEEVYVLQATPAAKALLSHAASPTASMPGNFEEQGNGEVRLIIVLNETGIAGKYDVSLKIPKGDAAAAKAALAKNLGLNLVQEKRSIEMVIVDSASGEKASDGSASKPK